MKPADASSPSNEQVAPLPAPVVEIGKIHFEGNIIPHQWYQRIRLESGKPDLPAIVILAEIVYWYRPFQTLDQDGKPYLRKHFNGDMFQCSAAYFEAKFGLTKDQTRKALKRLEDAGYIRREYRSIVRQGILMNNVMFAEPVPLAIMAITHPVVATEAPPPQADPPSPVGAPLSPVGDTPSPVGDTLSPVGDTNTETTTEITTTTTTQPSSSTNERAAEPETARGGGGDRDEKTKDPDGDHGETAQEPNEEKTVGKEEAQPVAATEGSSDTTTENPKTVASEEATDEQRPETHLPGQADRAGARRHRRPSPPLTDRGRPTNAGRDPGADSKRAADPNQPGCNAQGHRPQVPGRSRELRSLQRVSNRRGPPPPHRGGRPAPGRSRPAGQGAGGYPRLADPKRGRPAIHRLDPAFAAGVLRRNGVALAK